MNSGGFPCMQSQQTSTTDRNCYNVQIVQLQRSHPYPSASMLTTQSSIRRAYSPTKKGSFWDSKDFFDLWILMLILFRFQSDTLSRFLLTPVTWELQWSSSSLWLFPIKSFHVHPQLSLFSVPCFICMPYSTSFLACGENRPSNHLWWKITTKVDISQNVAIFLWDYTRLEFDKLLI